MNIDVYSIYSPFMEDAEIFVGVKIGRVIGIYDPITINKVTKLCRHTRSSVLKDMESFKLALMNDQDLDPKRAFDDTNFIQFKQSCQKIKKILVKVVIEA